MITKAIIPVAGWGTRRLPITKVIEKSMLPIGDRPIVDYVVEDCLKAGIKEFYFVVNDEDSQVEQYYRDNKKLEEYLIKNNKTAQLKKLKTTPDDVKLHFIVQPEDIGYGTAIPVALAADKFKISEPTAVLMGDDFIWNEDGSSELKRLIGNLDENDSSAMLGVEVPMNEVSKYGVLDIDENNNFQRIVEKPAQNDAPSNLINISKYIFSEELLNMTIKFVKDNPSIEGEYMITDPINQYVNMAGIMKVVPAKGQYLDGGNVDNWLHANNVVLGGK